MTVIIEEGLKQKFNKFHKAALKKEAQTLETLAHIEKDTNFELDSEQLNYIQSLAHLSLTSVDEAKQAVSMASTYLPESMWNVVVVCCDDKTRLPGVAGFLGDMHIKLAPSRRYNEYLQELGMLAVRVPPFPAYIDWFSRMEGVKLLGDGDRPVDPLPPPQIIIKPMGPLEAMLLSMMGGRDFPENMNIEPGGVRVAVLDSGIDADHPCLKGQVEKRYCITDNDLGPIDPDGHGTHVAGIIAGLWPIEYGLLGGIAPFVRLVDIQLWNPLGTTSLILIAGIGCAIKEQIDLINLSMGSQGIIPDGRSLEAMAIEVASENGIACCIASGNDGDKGEGTITVPSDAPSAISVAATLADGHRAPFSSMGPSADPALTGSKPTVAAPGTGIISARSRYSFHQPLDEAGLFVAMHGTSMATPIITGVCSIGLAYIKGKGRNKPDFNMLSEALKNSSVDFHGQGVSKVGFGVPQVPVFLSELDRMSSTETVKPTKTDPDRLLMQYQSAMTKQPTVMLSTLGKKNARNNVIAANPGPAHSIKKEKIKGKCIPVELKQKDKMDKWRLMEASFIQGVRNNLENYYAELSNELTGIGKVKLGDLIEDNDSNRLVGMGTSYSIDQGTLDAIPINMGFCTRILHKGKKPILGVIVKSFAGFQAIRKCNPAAPGMDASKLGTFMAKMRKKMNGIPCVFTFFMPEGWPDSIKECALGSGDREVLLCQPGQTAGEDFWYTILNPCDYWYMWLALTPMTFDRRRQTLLQFLLTHNDLKTIDAKMRITKISEEIGLPLNVCRKLFIEVSKQDRRFSMESDNFVKRIRITK